MALNPVRSGSGTNLKMHEYMAAGLPVVTTPFGARGICENADSYFVISDYPAMPVRIRDLLNNPSLAADLADKAYGLVKSRFDWHQIAAGYVHRLNGEVTLC